MLEEVESLCCSLQASGGRAVDPAPAVTRAVTNVVCTLVFSSTYRHDDPELTQVMEYNDGIVETIARGGLVDIYPWLRVHTHTHTHTLTHTHTHTLTHTVIVVSFLCRSFPTEL